MCKAACIADPDRKMALLCTVSESLLRFVCFLSDTHGKFECYQSNGEKRFVSEIRDYQKNRKRDRSCSYDVDQPFGNGLQFACDICYRTDHKRMAEQKTDELQLFGTSERYASANIAFTRYGRIGLLYSHDWGKQFCRLVCSGFCRCSCLLGRF